MLARLQRKYATDRITELQQGVPAQLQVKFEKRFAKNIAQMLLPAPGETERNIPISRALFRSANSAFVGQVYVAGKAPHEMISWFTKTS